MEWNPHNMAYLALFVGITDADGNIRWNVILGSILSGAIIGLSAAVIQQGQAIAALEARQSINLERVSALENGNSQATNSRFRREDGEAMERRMNERITDRMVSIEARFADVDRRIADIRADNRQQSMRK